MKFQILDGKHQVFTPLENPGQIQRDIYIRGDIIETDVNLVAMWNHPGSRKFARVADNVPCLCSRPDGRQLDVIAEVNPESPPVEPVRDFSEQADGEQETDDTFSRMTVPQLKAIAEENEIDLDGATRKEDIRDKVMEHAGA